MSIIIQAGHKTSKSKQLMEKLYERGLSKPIYSYTHKMTPEQVSETFYKILSRENISCADEKMADNIMIDFLLANLDSENWGWESDKNLVSLEYWEHIEPDVRFILVFDHPNNILKELTDVALTSDMIDQAMNEWVNYHQRVLSFLKNNDKKAILVEGAGAISNTNDLSKQVKNLATSLQFKSSWQILGVNEKDPNIKTDWNDKSDVVIDILAIEVLRKYPEVIKTFNLMLDKACIKYSDPIYKTKTIKLEDLIGLLSFIKKNGYNHQYLLEKRLLNEKVDSTRKTTEKKELDNQKLLEQYERKISDLKAVENEIDNQLSYNKLEQENRMLTEQLYCTQKELEKHYTKSQNIPENNVQKVPPLLKPVYYGAKSRVKEELAYRIGEKMVKAKRPKDIVALPLLLAKEYQIYEMKKESFDSLPDIKEYNDFDEGRKVKEHLSYRLGSLVVNTSRSPISFLKMPLEIGKEIVIFKMKRKK